ncbi:MAG: hypothetical protein ACI9EF_003237, partial [Pseudohongiellaceae bacterium]
AIAAGHTAPFKSGRRVKQPNKTPSPIRARLY